MTQKLFLSVKSCTCRIRHEVTTIAVSHLLSAASVVLTLDWALFEELHRNYSFNPHNSSVRGTVSIPTAQRVQPRYRKIQ